MASSKPSTPILWSGLIIACLLYTVYSFLVLQDKHRAATDINVLKPQVADDLHSFTAVLPTSTNRQVGKSIMSRKAIAVEFPKGKTCKSKSRLEGYQFPYPDPKYKAPVLTGPDESPRCRMSNICEGSTDCGSDGLGCMLCPEDRADVIRQAAKWSWAAYKRYAWGSDEVDPLNRQPSGDWMHLGATIVDSLDTLWIMGLKEEFAEARAWIAANLHFDTPYSVSVFETGIRVLGGLITAHYLTLDDISANNTVFLEKAVQIGDRLLKAFTSSGSGLPLPMVTLTGQASNGYQNLAGVASMQLELTALSRATGDSKYEQAGLRVYDVLRQMGSAEGLFCTHLEPSSARCSGYSFTFGGEADSAYEYMIKLYVLTGRKNKDVLAMWKAALQGMRRRMVKRLGPYKGTQSKGANSDIWIVATGQGHPGATTTVVDDDMSTSDAQPKTHKEIALNGFSTDLYMEHLLCFLPGSIALGHLVGVNSRTSGSEMDDLELAAKLMPSCWQLYAQSPTGLAYEAVTWSTSKAQRTLKESAGTQTRKLAEHVGAAFDLLNRQLDTHTTRHQKQLLQQRSDSGADVAQLHPKHSQNIQRPEFVESCFYMYRLTGDETYRDWGWMVFRAFYKSQRIATGGFASVPDANQYPARHSHVMQSFWMAETLKYLYLLFSKPDVMPLDKYVFNTEAHPIPVFQ